MNNFRICLEPLKKCMRGARARILAGVATRQLPYAEVCPLFCDQSQRTAAESENHEYAH
jgi:hypothetical protein